MKNRKPDTAEEVVTRLERDPEYQRKLADRLAKLERSQREAERIWEPISNELLAAGFEIKSVNDVAKLGRLPTVIVQILLSWLPRVDRKGTLEMMIRSLAAVQEPFDGTELAACFDRMDHEPGLQWVIANTIACSKPHSIDEWVERLRENNYWRKTLDDLGYKRKKGRKKRG